MRKPVSFSRRGNEVALAPFRSLVTFSEEKIMRIRQFHSNPPSFLKVEGIFLSLDGQVNKRVHIFFMKIYAFSM